MRISRKRLARLGLGSLIAVVLLGAIARAWLVPMAIVAAVRAHYDGHVSIEGWWIDGHSSGVDGLVLHEGPAPGSPVLARVARVAIDLGWRDLARGRFAPRRIAFDRPDIAFRIRKDGQPLTRVPLRGGGSGGAVPELLVRDGRLAMRQEGRPELAVSRLEGRLVPDPSGPRFHLESDAPEWGGPTIDGAFGPDFGSFAFRLNIDRLDVDRDKTARVPFIDPSIFQFVDPVGTIGARVDFASPKALGGAPEIVSTLRFEGTRVALPTLGLVGEEAFGNAIVRDGTVELRDARGRMAGGRVAISGTLDFSNEPYHHELAVALDGVDLAALPASWDFEATGIRGRTSGAADLKMTLLPSGIDATGTRGWGRLEGTSVEGVPLGEVRLKLRASGPRSTTAPPPQGPFVPQWLDVEIDAPRIELAPAAAALAQRHSHFDSSAREHPNDTPIVVGRLALNASVRAPLGAFDDLGAYTVHGSAQLEDVAVRGRALGPLAARFAMDRGVLDVTDARGAIVDRAGNRDEGPRRGPARVPPAIGPMLPGGVRGQARVEFQGDRPIELRLEGTRLPLSELAAFANRAAGGAAETNEEAAKIGGAIAFEALAHSRWSAMNVPRGWSVSGRAEIDEASYQRTALHDFKTTIDVDEGHLTFSDASARFAGAPLSGRLDVELAAPWAFKAALETDELSIGEWLAMVPRVPANLPVSGTLSGKAEARGTVEPPEIRSDGRARVSKLKTRDIDWGDVPFHWATEGEDVLVSAEDVQHYGGTMRVNARVPVRAGRPIEGTFILKNVDAAELSKDAPGDWKLAGRADGQGRFRVLPGHESRPMEVEAEAELSAPDLTVRGVSARAVELKLTVRDDVPRASATAKMLGGTVRLAGEARSGAELNENALQARIEAAGLKLFEVWKAVGLTGGLADLRGEARLTGHARTRVDRTGPMNANDLQGGGTVALDRLVWGYDFDLGRIRAPFRASADRFSVGPLDGELWGSPVRGDGVFLERNRAGAERTGIDLRLDRIRLGRGLAFLPAAAERIEGLGQLRLQGRSQDDFRGRAEFRVDRALVNELELTRFRAPADWVFTRAAPHRGVLNVRNAGGNLAGGRLGLDARIALGVHRDFRATLTVDDVDLRVISRDAMASRPVVGRLTGFLALEGPDPLRPEDYRGELDFDLVHASLLDVPLLDALDRALGSAQGGVFDEGDLHGTIASRKLLIDNLTLVGPLAQVHATGWLDFEGHMNIEAVINTARALPAAGQALLAQAPRLADAVAGRAARIDQVADAISARLMKFRITGTLDSPIVHADSSINARAALGFFIKTFRLSLQSRGR